MPGSARTRSILFSVDVEVSGMGPWYAWPRCDPTAFEEAVEDARDRFLEARAIATSHSPPVVDDPEAVEAALDRFQAHDGQRDGALLAAFEARGSEGAHVESNPAIRYWTRVTTVKHLERLAANGRAERDGDRWIALSG